MRRLMVRSKTSPMVDKAVVGQGVVVSTFTPAYGWVPLSPAARVGSEGRIVKDSARVQTVGLARPVQEETSREGETPVGMVTSALGPDTPRQASTSETDGQLQLTISQSTSSPSFFEDRLPREIRLMVLQSIIDLHREDHEVLLGQGRWKGVIAKQRWVGEPAGRRELLRFRAVSRESGVKDHSVLPGG
jgi:hypothetical protein